MQEGKLKGLRRVVSVQPRKLHVCLYAQDELVDACPRPASAVLVRVCTDNQLAASGAMCVCVWSVCVCVCMFVIYVCTYICVMCVCVCVCV